MSALPIVYPLFSARNSTGLPLVGGKLFTYGAGTNIPAPTYTTAAEGQENTNPVILNARGEAPVWLDSATTYKLVLEDALGNTIWTVDNVPGGQGAGSGVYPQTPQELAAGITPVQLQYPPGTVDRYGINGNPGTTDMTLAIQNAVYALNNWGNVANVSPNKDTFTGADIMQGGYVQFLAEQYGISNTIMLAPNVYLKGVAQSAPQIGTNPGGSTGEPVSQLIALPGFPTNQYMVDSAPWRFTNNNGSATVSPYRVVDATEYIGQSATQDNNPSTVNCGILNLALNGSNLAFGGYRAQCIFYARSNNISVGNVQYCGICFYQGFEHSIGRVYVQAPIAMYVDLHESFMQDEGELGLYGNSSSSTAWNSANQATIDAAFYQSGISAFANCATGQPQAAMWGGLATKGLLISAANCTIGYLAENDGNVGLHAGGRINILHWENEYTGRTTGGNPGPNSALFLLQQYAQVICRGLSTKAQCPLASGDPASQLIIDTPQFLAFSGGPNLNLTYTPYTGAETPTHPSTMAVQLVNVTTQDGLLGSFSWDCSVLNNTRLFNSISAQNGSHPLAPVTLRVNSNSGNPNSAGMGEALGTVDSALTFIQNNPQITQWVIQLADGQTHTISQDSHLLTEQDITFTRSFANSVPTLTATANLGVTDCIVRLGQIILSGWTSSAFFNVSGTHQLQNPIGGSQPSTISIPAGKALWSIFGPGTTASGADIYNGLTNCSLTFGAGASLVTEGAGGETCLYRDHMNPGSNTIAGTPLFTNSSAATSKVLSSLIVPQQAWGLTTIGPTPITVTHGMAGTPLAVLVLPIAGTVSGYSVTNLTATTFQIAWGSGGTTQFYWMAKTTQAPT